MKEALFFATSHWRLPLLIIGFSYPVGKIHLAGFLDFVDPSRSCETPGGLAGLGGSLTQLCSALRSADQRLEGFSGFPTPKQLLGSKNHFFLGPEPIQLSTSPQTWWSPKNAPATLPSFSVPCSAVPGLMFWLRARLTISHEKKWHLEFHHKAFVGDKRIWLAEPWPVWVKKRGQ